MDNFLAWIPPPVVAYVLLAMEKDLVPGSRVWGSQRLKFLGLCIGTGWGEQAGTVREETTVKTHQF